MVYYAVFTGHKVCSEEDKDKERTKKWKSKNSKSAHAFT